MGARETSAPAAAAAAAATSPHVVFIFFPVQTQLNPTLCFAKRLAAKGLLVTCCTTSGVGARLSAASSAGAVFTGGGDGVRVGRGRVRFEFLDDHGHDKEDLMRYFETPTPAAAFAELLGRQAEAGRPVTFVVGSAFLPWAVDVAADAGFPAAVLWVQSCTVLSLYYHYARGLVEVPPEDDADARVAVPGLPPLSVADVPSFLLPSNPHKKLAAARLAKSCG